MRFVDRAGREYSLLEASCLGRPGTDAPFSPLGEDDLRPAIYAPDSSYADFAASALAALFPGDIDPRLSQRLAETAFAEAPPLLAMDEGVAVLDLGCGKTGSRADRDAAFLAAVLGQAVRQRGPRFALAEGKGAEGPALAMAMSGIEGLETVLLYPEGYCPPVLPPEIRKREGGSINLISVRGGSERIADLIAAAVGTSLAGREVGAAGQDNPARLAARIIEFAALFAAYRSGAVGEFLFGVPKNDGIGLASCLWAWRLGVPLTGAVMPCDLSMESVGIRGVCGRVGTALIERLESESPGLVKSLVAFREVDSCSTASSLGRVDPALRSRISPAGAEIIAAAECVLDSGLRGHATVYTLIDRDSASLAENQAPDRGADVFDAVISPELSELSAVLAR